MRRFLFSTLFMGCLALSAGAQAIEAAAVLDQLGISRGICVVVGDPSCELAIALAENSELLVYAQVKNDGEALTAARAAEEAGLYGTRVFIDQGPLSHLHLADSIADGLVAAQDTPDLSKSEALRVLRPEGKALAQGEEWVKAFPAGADDWSHPYHGPDNNPQSNDTLARAPYLSQFLAEPRYAPLPQVAVASAGRVFKAFGHVAFKEREEAFLNTLAAFNGYNGTLLWKRELPDGYMVHRNNMIATPERLYVGDDSSCKIFDAKTGALLDEIIPDTELTGGTFWKWMALTDMTLYAIVGGDEQRDAVVKLKRDKHGWPWNPVSPGFNQPEHPWGFGKTLLAINAKTKEILWHYQEEDAADTRAVCMNRQNIFLFRFGAYLTCLDAKSGSLLWRKTPENAPELFTALGDYSHRQGYQTNWRTTAYLKCSEEALYFAGPQVEKLLCVSAKDGAILWENPYNNFQLVLREEGLYGVSGHWGNNVSRKFDPLTGEVLAEIDMGRRACTRPTGAADAIFFRAQGGTTRYDVASNKRQWVSPMRPNCHDGVTIANGLLYWWPSTCDCQLTLYGITCLGPAGNFDFSPVATEEERLKMAQNSTIRVAPLHESPADWPTFRANNHGTMRSLATIPPNATTRWESSPQAAFVPTAPVAVGDLTFIGGSDGILRAINTATGKTRWLAYTGGAIRISPAVWEGRVLVGSADGRVYSFEAQTGHLLWSFRAAPAERKIPVYGALRSTWPVATGVRVEKGIAYFAAGIVNYDGTYVYALDAVTGAIQWQNNTSGHLDKAARTGVSVQGPLLVHGDTLYMPGGSSVSPARYNLADGACLNDPAPLQRLESSSPRGWELYLIGDKVAVAGQPYYGDPDYPVVDPTAVEKTLHISTSQRDIAWINNNKIMVFNPIDKALLNKSVREPGDETYMIPIWGKLTVSEKPLWEFECANSLAVAASDNAVLVADAATITALDMQNGNVLWSHPLPAPPVPWGLAVDRDGRVLLSLKDGTVLCFS
jgi:outer membrane protein assembly factor BamB